MGGSIVSRAYRSKPRSKPNSNLQAQLRLVRMRHHGSANSPTNSMLAISGLAHRSRWYYLPARCVRSPARSRRRLLTTLPVAIAAYCAFAAEFLIRYARDRPIRYVPGEAYRGTMDFRLRCVLYAMFVTTVFIIIRYAARSSSFSLHIVNGL
jgi:hypothetical protein